TSEPGFELLSFGSPVWLRRGRVLESYSSILGLSIGKHNILYFIFRCLAATCKLLCFPSFNGYFTDVWGCSLRGSPAVTLVQSEGPWCLKNRPLRRRGWRRLCAKRSDEQDASQSTRRTMTRQRPKLGQPCGLMWKTPNDNDSASAIGS